MLKQHQNLIDRVYILLSGVLIVCVFGDICWFFDSIGHKEFLNGGPYIQCGIVFALCVLVCMYVRGFSASIRVTSYWHMIGDLAVCFLYGLLGYAACMMLIKLPQISRVYFSVSYFTSFMAVGSFHLLARRFYEEIREKDLNVRTVLIVANKHTIGSVIKEIEKNKSLGLKIAGLVGLEDKDELSFHGYPYWGNIRQLEQILNNNLVDYVLFVTYRQNIQAVEQAMLLCRERGIEIWVKPDFMHFESKFAKVDYLGRMPLFVFTFTPEFLFGLMIKRFLDIMISMVLLIVLSLPLVMIGLLIKWTSCGPILFRQKRMGRNNRVFTMYKFRTMYNDRKEGVFLVNEMEGPAFKMKKDPRITPMGKILRKYSIDELPQLWNVLLGEMSLVGPRPALPSEVTLYHGWQRRRFSMRPGITCIWQVRGRNKITNFNQWVELDLQYIDGWSIWLDMKILFQTILTVIKGSGV